VSYSASVFRLSSAHRPPGISPAIFQRLKEHGQGVAAIADMHDDEDMSSEIAGQGGSNRLRRIEAAGCPSIAIMSRFIFTSTG
jgi:hypothetical protein